MHGIGSICLPIDVIRTNMFTHRDPKVEYILQREKYTCSSKINVRFGFSALENLISRGTLARSQTHVLRKVLCSPGGGGVLKVHPLGGGGSRVLKMYFS